MMHDFRTDFPVFHQHPELVYLDSAATTQKPRSVIDALTRFYSEDCAPVGRSPYKLARQADRQYRAARQTIGQFIGAAAEEIIFTKSATESANLLARSWALPRLGPDCSIVITAAEHNSNYLPWAAVCRETGAALRVCPLDAQGVPDLDALDRLTDRRTVLVACTAASNVTGSALPPESVSSLCRRKGIPLALDGAQWVPHHPVDVHRLGCDFLFFSGHKLYGPSGAGILYAAAERLPELSPFLLGGGMICGDNPDCFAEGFQRFEAGSPDAAAFIGLAAAVDYLTAQGWDRICAHEAALARQMRAGFASLAPAGVRLLGPDCSHGAVYSFVCPGVHPFDLAVLLNGHRLAVRSGTLCAQHWFRAMGLESGCVRASLALYNTPADIDIFFNGLEDALHRLRRKGRAP